MRYSTTELPTVLPDALGRTTPPPQTPRAGRSGSCGVLRYRLKPPFEPPPDRGFSIIPKLKRKIAHLSHCSLTSSSEQKKK